MEKAILLKRKPPVRPLRKHAPGGIVFSGLSLHILPPTSEYYAPSDNRLHVSLCVITPFGQAAAIKQGGLATSAGYYYG